MNWSRAGEFGFDQLHKFQEYDQNGGSHRNKRTNMAAANGLKVVAVLQYPTSFYADPWDPQAAASFCAWTAQTEGSKIAAFEITNEPNNGYAATEKTGLESETRHAYERCRQSGPCCQSADSCDRVRRARAADSGHARHGRKR
jgi:hypothetical protein